MNVAILVGGIAVLSEPLLEKSEMAVCVCVSVSVDQVLNLVVFA